MSRKLSFVLACVLLPVIAACTPAGDEMEKPASLEPSM